jgi:putative membrane protein
MSSEQARTGARSSSVPRTDVVAEQLTPAPRPHTRLHLHLRLRVRPLLLRFLANALALALTAIVVPNIHFSGDYRILSWLLISAVFGLLNAFLKPLIQVVMLPLIFVSYGLVVVLINTILLLTLSWIFPQRFHVHTLIWALVGGLVCGLLEGLLQDLFGLTPPIAEGGPDALRKGAGAPSHESLETNVPATVGTSAVADEATPVLEVEDAAAASPAKAANNGGQR